MRGGVGRKKVGGGRDGNMCATCRSTKGRVEWVQYF